MYIKYSSLQLDVTITHVEFSQCDKHFLRVKSACRQTGMPLDSVVCNAAVYLPTAKEPRFSADGLEISVATNHLGHFLLANLLLEDLQQRKQTASQPPRMIIVGSITGNTNTVAGMRPLHGNARKQLHSRLMRWLTDSFVAPKSSCWSVKADSRKLDSIVLLKERTDVCRRRGVINAIMAQAMCRPRQILAI